MQRYHSITVIIHAILNKPRTIYAPSFALPPLTPPILEAGVGLDHPAINLYQPKPAIPETIRQVINMGFRQSKLSALTKYALFLPGIGILNSGSTCFQRYLSEWINPGQPAIGGSDSPIIHHQRPPRHEG